MAVIKQDQPSFAAPPPGAPQQTTTPGSERPTVDQLRTARANEQALQPFTPGARPMTIEQQAAFLGKSVAEVEALRVAAQAAARARVPKARPVAEVEAAAGDPAGGEASVVPAAPAGKLRRVSKPLPRSGGAGPAAVPVAEDAAEAAAPQPPVADQVPPEAQPAPTPAAPPPVADQAPEPYRPAASNTDSPARGVPTASADPGKRITGGFGESADAQYFPLDGTEIREVVLALMDQIGQRLQDDLRFSVAATYARSAVRVVVEIDAFGSDKTLTVEKIPMGADAKRLARTPIDIARRHGDRIVFCVVAERSEFDADGNASVAPNQTRQELELPIPRKQAVQVPGGRMLVDVR